jgi:hypothetical protein
MTENEVGCARPTGGPIGDAPEEASGTPATSAAEEEEMSTARVGQKAPDFESPAYHKGKFTSVKLSDHLGKWVLLCFYPGDFTYV